MDEILEPSLMTTKQMYMLKIAYGSDSHEGYLNGRSRLQVSFCGPEF